MNIRKNVVGVLAAGAIMLSTVMGVAAQTASTTGSASITINSGGWGFSVKEAGFPVIPFDFEEQTATGGKIVLNFWDKTGDFEGWSVSVSPSNFEGPSGSSIPFTNMVLAGSTPVSNAGQGTSGITPTYPGNLTWTASSGNGSGDYDLTTTASLLVPGQTQVGTYTSTLTVTGVNNAP